MKCAFRHIYEYYSPQNISTITNLFIENASSSFSIGATNPWWVFACHKKMFGKLK
jgi:hypothetical protein